MIWITLLLFACEQDKLTINSEIESESNNEVTQPASEPSQEDDTQEPSSPSDEDTDEGECADPEGTEFADPNSLEGRIDCGEDVYFSSCASCHGADGGGASGPALMGLINQLQDSYITESILGGQGNMPAINISPQQVADVIAYIRDRFDP